MVNKTKICVGVMLAFITITGIALAQNDLSDKPTPPKPEEIDSLVESIQTDFEIEK